MENKKSTKRRVIAITVLASLLIALLAFNVTYAYFTDRIDGSASLTFGTVNIDASGPNAIAIAAGQTTNVLPGQTVRMQGTITNTSTTPIWVKFDVPTTTIKLKLSDTEIAEGTTNSNYNNHSYTDEEIASMKTAVQNVVVAGFKNIITGTNNASWAISDDGITAAAVPVDATALNLSDGTAGFTFTGEKFGNLFQGVTVSFDFVILAVQAGENSDNLTRTQAAAAFSNTEFNSGEFAAA